LNSGSTSVPVLVSNPKFQQRLGELPLSHKQLA
jgi:hypothetical protein